MRLFASLRSFVSTLLHRSHVDVDMDDELRSHIQHRADDLERSGLGRPEAERRARIEFGGYQQFKEECHEAIGANFFATLMQDVRYGLRMLRKSPGFTIAAVLTLALAIGANAVVFSVLNALILRPLNVPHAESLYGIWHMPGNNMSESYPDYVDLRDRNHSFDGLVAYSVDEVGLNTGDDPSRAWLEETSGNYFDALGLQPYLGHFFHASDEHGPNSAPYMVLTYAFWHAHFQDDRGIVGRVVRVNKHPFTIIGVAQPEFHGTLSFFNPDFFVPIVNRPVDSDDLNSRQDRCDLYDDGTPEAGRHPAQAIADLNSIGADLAKTYPKDDAK